MGVVIDIPVTDGFFHVVSSCYVDCWYWMYFVVPISVKPVIYCGEIIRGVAIK